jgi:hypothetical protein
MMWAISAFPGMGTGGSPVAVEAMAIAHDVAAPFKIAQEKVG